jgi:hypothetical protein
VTKVGTGIAFIVNPADAPAPVLPTKVGEVLPMEILYPLPVTFAAGIVKFWVSPVVLPLSEEL